MGYKQTSTHRYGKGSFHQIGLVRGQFGNIPMDKWVPFVKDAGFDGWEEASWELDLGRCGTDADAEAYAKERVELAKKHGLEIFTVAAHLQGQALGDEPSAKTLQFIGGEAVQAYKAWRDKGNKPPRTDPYYVPDEVGRMIHESLQRSPEYRSIGPLPGKAAKSQGGGAGVCRFARSLLEPFLFVSPLPSSISGHVPTPASQSGCSRAFKPVWDACKIRRHLRS